MTQQYTQEDIRLREAAIIRIKNEIQEVDVPMQFPPRITSDGKKAQWQEEYIAAYEPLAIWKGSSARHISVKIEYMVDGGDWTPEFIMQQVRNLKSYFYITLQQGQSSYPVIELDLYEIVPDIGDRISTWRADDISIAYDGPLITQNDVTCNLKTTVTLSMYLFTVISNLTDSTAEGKTGGNGLEKIEFSFVAAALANTLKEGISADLNKWF